MPRHLSLLLTSLAVVAAADAALAQSPRAVRPNIILIISDDHGYADYGFMGHQTVQTPHLDRIAAQGLLYTRGYVMPVCSPSLASLLTGQLPHRHGITGNDLATPPAAVAGRGQRYPLSDRLLRNSVLLPKALTDAGYLTFQSGKLWNTSFGDVGFTHGMTATPGRHGDAGLVIGRKGLQPLFDFMDDARTQGKPFFVWYAPMLPHGPHDPPEDILRKYLGRGPTPAAEKYYAMVEWFDRTCGDLDRYLADHKLTDNTVVLYLADNGWDAALGYAGKRAKLSPYELGIRTPMFVRWPGHVSPHRDDETLASIIDVVPTILKLAGAKAPGDLPGLDITDTAAMRARKAVFVEAYTHDIADLGAPEKSVIAQVVISGWSKLIMPGPAKPDKPHSSAPAEIELFDLRADPRELTNLARQRPDEVQRLKAMIAAADAALAQGPRTVRPNIVFIVADDLGWTDLGVYGSTYYETPRIDRLASQGMRFTEAYANPNCAPTRAALMTGRYGPRTGIYTVDSGARGLEAFRRMIPVENRTSLAPSEVTVAERFRDAGYATAHIGKWHLGGDTHLPTSQGFDLNVAGNATGSPKGGYFSPYDNPQLADGPTGEYLTDRLASEAVAFLKANRERPFFLYLPFYAVHTPIEGKPALIEKYTAKRAAGGHRNPAYAAMVETMDTNVGRVLDALDELALAPNTIVVFMSDNGGVGGYQAAGVKARDITDNAPLRGGKGMLYEGGVRVPLVVRFPGRVAPGKESPLPVMCVDFLPTLLELAGLAPSAGPEIDGTSFAGELLGRPPAGERPPIYWHFPGYLEAGPAQDGAWRTAPAGAIRKGTYKLVEFFETGTVELYDLARDIGERHDLAAAEPARTRELRENLAAWRARLDAPMPRAK